MQSGVLQLNLHQGPAGLALHVHSVPQAFWPSAQGMQDLQADPAAKFANVILCSQRCLMQSIGKGLPETALQKKSRLAACGVSQD